MANVANIAEQAVAKGLKASSEFFITPGSEQIRATIERDGITDVLESIGGKVLANACGPCIGQWNRINYDPKEDNVIFTSFNRNFKGRNDGSAKTMNFLASPEIVTAMALSGSTTFNPTVDSLIASNGTPFKLLPPKSEDLPNRGFLRGRDQFGYPVQSHYDDSLKIDIDPSSDRLQILDPFPAWDGEEFKDMKLLVKVKGKCTTDHISAAGPWLKYKGHLENISKNTLIGAVNAFTGQVNATINQISRIEDSIPNVAFFYRKQGIPWLIVADSNYGEGSAREHAAMQPRYLGCKMVVAKAFARIHGKKYNPLTQKQI
jgi:aconitase A